MPPSTVRVAPVTNELSSLARATLASALISVAGVFLLVRRTVGLDARAVGSAPVAAASAGRASRPDQTAGWPASWRRAARARWGR